MSGGSMDYICYRVEEAANMCEDAELAELLHDASKVLHDEEWWRSCDSSEETYRESLAKFKAKWFKGDRVVQCRLYQSVDYENLRKALDFMRIWISDDAHLGESAISREFEKAEGLRRLAEIEDAIVAKLRGDAEHREEIVQCRACRYFPICSFTKNYADPEIFYTWGEKKKDE